MQCRLGTFVDKGEPIAFPVPEGLRCAVIEYPCRRRSSSGPAVSSLRCYRGNAAAVPEFSPALDSVTYISVTGSHPCACRVGYARFQIDYLLQAHPSCSFLLGDSHSC